LSRRIRRRSGDHGNVERGKEARCGGGQDSSGAPSRGISVVQGRPPEGLLIRTYVGGQKLLKGGGGGLRPDCGNRDGGVRNTKLDEKKRRKAGNESLKRVRR